MAYLLDFEKLVKEQLERVEHMKNEPPATDFSAKEKIVIGFIDGDGIGPVIMKETKRVLEHLLADEIESGKVEMKTIEGLTLENRIEKNNTLPDDVLESIKQCDVFMKGPTATPDKLNSKVNIESANVALRRELDLFANVRPISIPELGIDWTFFRENTEGGYAVGSHGVNITDDLAVDFTVATQEGCERIAKLAYDYAEKNHKGKVSIITKANIIKTTDGKFLKTAQRIGKEYPDIVTDDWYIDITTAKLIDPARRKDFKVFVLPNLYGDIITDEAAEFQGGVGTAGSANIGKKYAMFEAIHGSAPRMINEGRGKYADPCSMLRATVMLLSHIGYQKQADALEAALDKCMFEEKKYVITGRDTGCTCDEFGDYVMDTITKMAE